MEIGRGKFFIFLISVPLLIAIIPQIVKPAPPSIPLPYHNGATLVCSDCHTMHASQQHGYTSGSGPAWSTTPTAKLLRQTTSVQLCLSCHDQKAGIPDVLTSDVNGIGDNRGAGFFAPLDTSTYKGHNLGTNPGSYLCSRCHFGPPIIEAKVTCIDCHNPHGNGGYRNLQWASSPGDPSQPKIIAFTNGTGINKYSQANIGYSAPSGDSTWREVTNICIDCHHKRFSYGFTNTGGAIVRHPSTNTESGYSFPINRSGANTDPTNWVNGTNGFAIGRLPFIVKGATGFAGATTVAANNEVFCLSCHKAHGSDNSFGLRWAYGSGPPGTNQAGCNQCHNK